MSILTNKNKSNIIIHTIILNNDYDNQLSIIGQCTFDGGLFKYLQYNVNKVNGKNQHEINNFPEHKFLKFISHKTLLHNSLLTINKKGNFAKLGNAAQYNPYLADGCQIM